MRFDWVAFLQRYGIEYVTTGPNASRDHVNVRCPFCGSSDPTQHLGISLTGRGWSCWRNSAHKGRSRAKLIQALLGCSNAEAQRIAGAEEADLPEGSVSDRLHGQLLSDERVAKARPEFPSEVRSLAQSSRFGEPFRNYLRARGYAGTQLRHVIEDYDLHYAVRGRWAYRLIVPVRDRNSRLLTWVGRTILPDKQPRYRALSRGEELVNIRDTLLGLDFLWHCTNPRVLLVCEGPFDAMWITTYGKSLGVYATCLFGLRVSEAQALLLDELRGRFNHIALLLDHDAALQSFRLAQGGLGLDIRRLPSGIKDPAVLPPERVLDLCFSVLNG